MHDFTKKQSDQLAIVSGGASGIGFAISTELASEGYSVAIIDRDPATASDAAKRIRDITGATVIVQCADVADKDATRQAFDCILNTLGPPAILVNNAGILVRAKCRLEDLPENDISEMMAIHVEGTLNWSRLVIPHMRRKGFGRIINVSSVNALNAVPYRIAYVMAKKTILGFTEALALETARAGITVNAIAPGYIRTKVLQDRVQSGILNDQLISKRTPIGRWGEPHEIAKAVSFLASLDASYITGTTLVVDGGLSISGNLGDDLDTAPT